jgi:hypothetical protein
MPYVMMPVPEEHVEAVMAFILRTIERASIEDWDAEGISEAFLAVDEAARSLLAFVSKATLEGNELADADAARRIQLTVRETAGIISELQALARASNRPPLIVTRTVTDRLPNGRTKDRRVLQMDLEVAEFVRQAHLAEARQAPHPLAGDAE